MGGGGGIGLGEMDFVAEEVELICEVESGGEVGDKGGFEIG